MSLAHVRGKDIYLIPPETKEVKKKLLEQCSTPRPMLHGKTSPIFESHTGISALWRESIYPSTKLPCAHLETNHLLNFRALGCINYQQISPSKT